MTSVKFAERSGFKLACLETFSESTYSSLREFIHMSSSSRFSHQFEFYYLIIREHTVAVFTAVYSRKPVSI